MSWLANVMARIAISRRCSRAGKKLVQNLLACEHMAAASPAKIISSSLCEVSMRKWSRARNSWLGIWADACSLGFEASSVIGLRAMKLAVGGKAAATEAQRMVSEKIEASLALQGKALSGDLGTTALSAAAKTLDHYRQKVRANQTRLARAAARRRHQPKRRSGAGNGRR